jgi:hypothetical protein
MSLTVWKTVLEPLAIQDIEIPQRSELLTAAAQEDKICVWYRCDPSEPLVKCRVAIVGTGSPLQDFTWRYVGTAYVDNAFLVFHVFEAPY